MTGDGLSLLFVQNAVATSLAPGTGGIHTLTMTGVSTQTLHFSHRPARVTGAMPTATFINAGADVFASSPPNATLIGHSEVAGDADEAVVVEQTEPVYDATVASLTHMVQILGVDEIGAAAYYCTEIC